MGKVTINEGFFKAIMLPFYTETVETFPLR